MPKLIEVMLDGMKMIVKDSSTSKAMISNDAPHAHWCTKRAETLCELAAFKKVIAQLDVDDVDSVLELFGGSGWHSMCIQRDVMPQLHVSCDIDRDCVDSMKLSLPGVKAVCTDSYRYVSRFGDQRWDWVHADFNQYTFKRREQVRYRQAIEDIFRVARRYATITDSAIFGLIRFEKNRMSYANAIDMDPNDWKDYYRAVSEWYGDQYGFGVRYVIAWHSLSSMLLLERGRKTDYPGVIECKEKVPFEILKTKRSGR